jgi:hypothetical protein
VTPSLSQNRVMTVADLRRRRAEVEATIRDMSLGRMAQAQSFREALKRRAKPKVAYKVEKPPPTTSKEQQLKQQLQQARGQTPNCGTGSTLSRMASAAPPCFRSRW